MKIRKVNDAVVEMKMSRGRTGTHSHAILKHIRIYDRIRLKKWIQKSPRYAEQTESSAGCTVACAPGTPEKLVTGNRPE